MDDYVRDQKLQKSEGFSLYDPTEEYAVFRYYSVLIHADGDLIACEGFIKFPFFCWISTHNSSPGTENYTLFNGETQPDTVFIQVGNYWKLKDINEARQIIPTMTKLTSKKKALKSQVMKISEIGDNDSLEPLSLIEDFNFTESQPKYLHICKQFQIYSFCLVFLKEIFFFFLSFWRKK